MLLTVRYLCSQIVKFPSSGKSVPKITSLTDEQTP